MPPKKLVIDACIGHSSDTKKCKDVLETVLKKRYHVIMSYELWDEWKRHRGIYAKVWFKTMIERSRLYTLNVRPNDEFREQIFAFHEVKRDPTVKDIIRKDLHLVETALETDKTIISLDDKVREHLKKASASVEDLKIIVWVNPIDPGEDAVYWLEYGARPEDFRMLGYVDPDDKKYSRGHLAKKYIKEIFKVREKSG
jgi:hypothetical protein